MCNSRVLYLSKRDIQELNLPMKEIVYALETVFQEKGQGKVEMPPKPGIHPREDSSIRAMLAYIPKLDAAGVKWISGYGRNYIAGLPNINGLLILNEPESGIPLAVMDCTWITAKRTGACTAVSAKLLAKPNSKSLGLVSAGKQGRTNLEALSTCFPLEEVQVYDVNPEAVESFIEEQSELYPFKIRAAQTVEECVADKDIVVTAGPIVMEPKPVIRDSWTAPGSFLCALDFDAYVTEDAFSKAHLLATDDIPQLEYFRGCGHFKNTPEISVGLGRLAAGILPGRQSEQDKIIQVNLGIGVLDIAVASLIYKLAQNEEIGTLLRL